MTDKRKKMSYDEAYALAEEAGVKFPSIVAAQFGLESAWGTKTAGTVNNFFGIKYHEKAAQRLRDLGINVHKGSKVKDKTTGSTDAYMDFDSPKDAFTAYWSFINTNPRYAKALESNTPEEYIKAIKKAGYAEDNKYVSKIMEIAKPREGEGQGYKPQRGAIPGLSNTKEEGLKEKDNIPNVVEHYGHIDNTETIMNSIDFSASTVNNRQYDRMEEFIGGYMGPGAPIAPLSETDEVAKAAIDITDVSKLKKVVDPIIETPVEETVVPSIIEDTDDNKLAKGGYQPNGRVTQFSREEDIKAQGNTYEQLNIF